MRKRLETFFTGYGIIKPVSPGKMAAAITFLAQYPAGKITSQPGLAHEIYLLLDIYLPEPLPELVKRNIDETVHMASFVFLFSPYIKQEHTAVPWELWHLMPMELLYFSRY